MNKRSMAFFILIPILFLISCRSQVAISSDERSDQSEWSYQNNLSSVEKESENDSEKVSENDFEKVSESNSESVSDNDFENDSKSDSSLESDPDHEVSSSIEDNSETITTSQEEECTYSMITYTNQEEYQAANHSSDSIFYFRVELPLPNMELARIRKSGNNVYFEYKDQTIPSMEPYDLSIGWNITGSGDHGLETLVNSNGKYMNKDSSHKVIYQMQGYTTMFFWVAEDCLFQASVRENRFQEFLELLESTGIPLVKI